jgi:hypothetical protein
MDSPTGTTFEHMLARFRGETGYALIVTEQRESHEVGGHITVHVVIREDQNAHGLVHTSVVRLFRRRRDADAFVTSSVSRARGEGLRVCDDADVDADWEVVSATSVKAWLQRSEPTHKVVDTVHAASEL